MPTDMTRYGRNWPTFSRQIRYVRARSRCECCGQCGLHHGRRCVENHHAAARFAHGTIRLTVAHLCQCDPPCQNPNHVLAMCQRCHLRLDRWKHAHTKKIKKTKNNT